MVNKKRDVGWVDDQLIVLLRHMKTQHGYIPTPMQLRALRQEIQQGEREIVLPMMNKDMRNE